MAPASADRPAAALGLDGDGMQDPHGSLKLVARDLVEIGVVAEASGGGVVPRDSVGNRDREQVDGAGRTFDLDVDEADLDLVSQRAGDQEHARGHLAVALGQLRAANVVDRVSVIPALARDTQDTAGSDHIVDQLLGDRDVGLPGDRRFRPIDLVEVLTPGGRDRGSPGRPTAADRHQAATAQRRCRYPMAVVVPHDPVRASVGDPSKDRDLGLGKRLALSHQRVIATAARSCMTPAIESQRRSPRFARTSRCGKRAHRRSAGP
jgi:hypothetical protein